MGPHDASRDLIIDPVLSYGQQLSNPTTNIGAIVSDTAGNLYITGQSQAKGFYIEKSPAPLRSVPVQHHNRRGRPIGGIPPESRWTRAAIRMLRVSLRRVCLRLAGAYLNYTGKHSVPFVAELAANGTTVSYLSYLGGTTGTDYSTGIALDKSNHVYVTGYESSSDFPTTAGVYLGTNPNPGSYAAFVASFNPAASGNASLTYSTLIDATAIQSYGSGIAVDGSGNAYISVISNLGYPVSSGAFTYVGLVSDSCHTNGAYVTKLNANATAITYSAYLGPGTANSIAVDTSGAAYVTGIVQAE